MVEKSVNLLWMSKKEKNKANNAKCKKVTVGNCAYFIK